MKKGYLYVAIATFLFSTMEIVLKITSQGFNPVQVNFSRFFIGGLFLIPFARQAMKKQNRVFKTGDYKTFALLGFICVVISMMCFQLAVEYTKASVVAVLFSGNPIFSIILAYLILKEPINSPKILALICAISGILTIINPFAAKLNPAGVFFALLSTLAFALYSVLAKKPCAKLGGIVVTSMSFIFGSLELLILIMLAKIPLISAFLSARDLETFASVPLFSGYNLNNILYMVYIFVFVTGIGYAMYFKALEHTSISTVALIFFFKPILAPIFAFLTIKENIPLNMIIGIGIVLIGSLFAIYGNKKAASALISNKNLPQNNSEA